jgi:hypothetical protein
MLAIEYKNCKYMKYIFQNDVTQGDNGVLETNKKLKL